MLKTMWKSQILKVFTMTDFEEEKMLKTMWKMRKTPKKFLNS